MITYDLLPYDLVSDRPGFYNNPQTVDKGSITAEFGLQFIRINNGVMTIDPSLNTLKYGFTENVEIRLGIGASYTDNQNFQKEINSPSDWRQNLSSLGLKLNFIEDKDNILSSEISLTLPTINSLESLPPFSNISLLYNRKLNNEFAISTNLRYTFLDTDHIDTDIIDFHLALEHTPAEYLGWLIESWTNITFQTFYGLGNDDNGFTDSKQPGFTGINLALWFRVIPELQFDLQYATFLDTDNDPNSLYSDFIINFGCSFLLN